jgi:hypothetical protein
MKRLRMSFGETVMGVALVAMGSAAIAATYGETIEMYIVNLDWRTAAGTAAFQSFSPVRGIVVHYEPFTVNAGPSSTCVEIGSNSINGTNQIIWYEATPGVWKKLADNVVDTNPHAVVYTDGSAQLNLRIADSVATPIGIIQVRTQYVTPMTGKTYEARCDEWENTYRHWPYLKLKGKVITLVNFK